MEEKMFFVYEIDTHELIVATEELEEALRYLTDKKYGVHVVDAIDVWEFHWGNLHDKGGV